MSHWDFSRSPDGHHDAPVPAGQARTAYPPGLASGADDGTAPDGQPAWDGWPADDGTAENPWPADGQWPPGENLSADENWAAGKDSAADDGWSADDGWVDDEDEDLGPYPITYERDTFAELDPGQAAPAATPWEPWPPVPYPGDSSVSAAPGTTGDPGGVDPAAWADAGSEGAAPGGRWRGLRRTATTAAEPGWPDAELGQPDEAFADWADGDGVRPTRQGRGGRRWPIPAGVAVAGAAVGVAAVLLTGGHPGAHGSQATGGQGAGGLAGPSATPTTRAGTPAASPSASPSAPGAGPLTLTQAQGVLASYTSVNNGANAQRSQTQLATIETGSSYAIDSALYRAQQAAGVAPYPAFGPVQATYYIPRDEPATGPRWFVVQVANAFTSNPKKVTTNEYLLFTQSAPGGGWQNAVEPYLQAGANVPQITVGSDGLATAVSTDAATVAVTPGQLAATTAAALDGTGTGQAIADPGNLADRSDQRFWQGKIPGGQVTDAHTPAAGTDGQEFALLTNGGGALVFYTDAAEVTITPPAGSALRLTIPGLYSASQSLAKAQVSYLEQFAAYDPAAGGGTPRVVADYSGITGNN
jgi:hypothetical protein